MLLLVAAVVFAAGCAGKTNTAANETQGASNQTTPAPAEMPASAVTPAETSASTVTPVETPVETPAVTNNTTESVTGNNTSSVISTTPVVKIEQATENTTAQTDNHTSNAQRKLAIAQSRVHSSGAQNVSQ